MKYLFQDLIWRILFLCGSFQVFPIFGKFWTFFSNVFGLREYLNFMLSCGGQLDFIKHNWVIHIRQNKVGGQRCSTQLHLTHKLFPCGILTLFLHRNAFTYFQLTMYFFLPFFIRFLSGLAQGFEIEVLLLLLQWVNFNEYTTPFSYLELTMEPKTL